MINSHYKIIHILFNNIKNYIIDTNHASYFSTLSSACRASTSTSCFCSGLLYLPIFDNSYYP